MADAKQFQAYWGDPEYKGQRTEAFEVDKIDKVPIFIINPKTGGGLTTERVTELAASIKSVEGLRIAEELEDWRHFYTHPDLVFNNLVEGLGVDVMSLGRKVSPKVEDADQVPSDASPNDA